MNGYHSLWRLSRRSLLSGAGATGLLSACGQTMDHPSIVSPLSKPERSDSNERGPTRAQSDATVKQAIRDTHVPLSELATLSLSADWGEDRTSIDYAHLAITTAGQPFTLTGDVLQRLADQNGFAVASAGPLIAFGLRGCEFETENDSALARDFVSGVRLRAKRPSHRTFHCIMGVWRRGADGKISCFRASTVPAAPHVLEQVWAASVWAERDVSRIPCTEEHLFRTNLLPTGYYDYDIGDHGRSLPSGECLPADLAGDIDTNLEIQDYEIKGALIARGRPRAVLRSFRDLVYRADDCWHLDAPGDNIHASRTMQIADSVQRRRCWSYGDDRTISLEECEDEVCFSSAGCQVVEGDSCRGAEDGPWAHFRQRAALSGSGGRMYMLVTGDEAALMAHGDQQFARQRIVRPGTSGQGAAAMRDMLHLVPSAAPLDASTVMVMATRRLRVVETINL